MIFYLDVFIYFFVQAISYKRRSFSGGRGEQIKIAIGMRVLRFVRAFFL
jgi:hypothetical protein